MKKTILFFLMLFSATVYGQNFIVTPDGLRDSVNLDKTFVVITVDSMSAMQLYNNAVKYFTKISKTPDKVFSVWIEGEHLKLVTNEPNFFFVNNSGAKISIDANYYTEINFKDGKVKFEIIQLDMYDSYSKKYHVLFSGGIFD